MTTPIVTRLQAGGGNTPYERTGKRAAVSLTLRDAKQGTPGVTAGRPSLEPNPSLSTYDLTGNHGYPGELDEMFTTWHVLAANWRDFTHDVETMPDEIVFGEDDDDAPETPKEKKAREYLQRKLFRECITDSKNEANRGGWAQFKAHAATVFKLGTAITEVAEHPDSTLEDGYRVELFPIPLATVSRFDYDITDRDILLGIIQASESQSETCVDIERLIIDSHGAWPYGESIARPLLFIFRSCQRALGSYIRKLQNEEGVTVLTEPEGGSKENAERGKIWLQQWIRSESRILRLVHGYGIDYKAAPAGSSPVELMEWGERAANLVFGVLTQNMGASTTSGNRAMAVVTDARDNKVRVQFANRMFRRISSRLFPMVLRRGGFDLSQIRPPMLRVKKAARQMAPKEVAEILGMLKDKQLVTWGTADEKLLRESKLFPFLAEEMPPEPVAPPAEQAEPDAGTTGSDPEFSGLAAELVASDGGGCRWGGCGCGDATHVRLSSSYTVRDYDGVEFEMCRELLPQERVMSLAADEAQRAELHANLERRVAELANRYREAIFNLGPIDGVAQDIIDDHWRDLFGSLKLAYRAYANTVRDAAKEQGATERQRQQAAGIVEEGPGASSEALDAMAEMQARHARKTIRDAEISARVTANRIRAEVMRAWNDGATLETFANRTAPITDKGLARDARSIGNRQEAAARVFEAADAARQGGPRISKVIRTSVRDLRRCPHCRDVDGGLFPERGVWDLSTPEGVEQFLNDPNAQTPDPNCRGTQDRCRCGFVIVYETG